jgi:hypothetical protein
VITTPPVPSALLFATAVTAMPIAIEPSASRRSYSCGRGGRRRSSSLRSIFSTSASTTSSSYSARALVAPRAPRVHLRARPCSRGWI